MDENSGNPTPWEILEHPELAVISLLENALATASASLCATYPEFSEPDYKCRLPTGEPGPLLAEDIIAVASALTSLLRTYRRSLAMLNSRPPPTGTEDTDLPF